MYFFVCIIGIIFFICNANLAYSKESDSNCNILLGKSYEVSSEASEIYPDTGGEITDGNYALPYLTDQGWQGRESITSYTVTVDLGKITNIVGFKADFFRYENAGVILPDSVSLSVSKDGNNYIDICSGIKSTVFDEISSVAYVGNAKEKNVSGRYVRLTVSGKQWSFIDEWEVYSFKKKKNVESRFYGTFVQPELCEKWTESEWEREFALMKDVGMEHLILQWTADSKNMTTVYPSDISGFEQNTTSDLVAKVLNIPVKEATVYADELVEEFEFQKRGLVIQKISNHYQIKTRKEYHDIISKLFEKVTMKHLTNSTLETLAIIAYKQPITRQEIEEIRGVKCNSSIETLMSKDFIEEAGRLDRIGKPIIYKTTLNFLNQFNLKSLKDLPDIEKFISDEEKSQIVEDENDVEIEEDENK